MSSDAVQDLAPAPRRAVDPAGFRMACGAFATGITVVTVMGEDGQPYGMTANSFTSVSLDPPLVLICVDRKATMLPHLEAARYFGINVLSEHQRDLSTHFARKGVNRFDAIEWTPGEFGVPLLPAVLATFECEISQIIDAGDHRIFLGQARHLACSAGKPLLYVNSNYRTLE